MNTYRLLGQLYYDQSDYIKAEKEFDKALRIARNINNIGSQGWIYLDLAYLSEHEGNRLLAISVHFICIPVIVIGNINALIYMKQFDLLY